MVNHGQPAEKVTRAGRSMFKDMDSKLNLNLLKATSFDWESLFLNMNSRIDCH